jgi:hypothetical protein
MDGWMDGWIADWLMLLTYSASCNATRAKTNFGYKYVAGRVWWRFEVRQRLVKNACYTRT